MQTIWVSLFSLSLSPQTSALSSLLSPFITFSFFEMPFYYIFFLLSCWVCGNVPDVCVLTPLDTSMVNWLMLFLDSSLLNRILINLYESIWFSVLLWWSYDDESGCGCTTVSTWLFLFFFLLIMVEIVLREGSSIILLLRCKRVTKILDDVNPLYLPRPPDLIILIFL